MIDLDPFQLDGVCFLDGVTSKGALLADEPGLGKTRQAIKAAVNRTRRGDKIFVNCPASALPVWRRETRALAPEHTWVRVQYNMSGVVDPEAIRGKVLINDEVHYLKTPGSGRTADVFGPETDGIGGHVEHAQVVFNLSGTPTPNNPSEIWPVARANFPMAITKTYRDGTCKPMTWAQFVNRYCKFKVDYLGNVKFLPGGKNIAELRERLAPYFLRRQFKNVYKDVKEPRHSVLPILGDSPQCPSDRLGEWFLIEKTLKEHGVEGLADLSNFCASIRRYTGMAKAKGCADWIDDWVSTGGGPLVVFAYHKDVMRALSNDLARRKIRVVHGGPGADSLFQDDPSQQVFLGQIQRDGVAITLTRSHTVLMVEQSWVPSENEQPWKRCLRRGQTEMVDVRWAALEGSIDEDIADAWARKQRTISAMWDSDD